MKFRYANLLADEKSSFTHPPSYTEAVVQRCSVKKVLLEISQNSLENACASISFLVRFAKLLRTSNECNFIEKETLALVFSCDLHEISKNTFFI